MWTRDLGRGNAYFWLSCRVLALVLVFLGILNIKHCLSGLVMGGISGGILIVQQKFLLFSLSSRWIGLYRVSGLGGNRGRGLYRDSYETE